MCDLIASYQVIGFLVVDAVSVEVRVLGISGEEHCQTDIVALTQRIVEVHKGGDIDFLSIAVVCVVTLHTADGTGFVCSVKGIRSGFIPGLDAGRCHQAESLVPDREAFSESDASVQVWKRISLISAESRAEYVFRFDIVLEVLVCDGFSDRIESFCQEKAFPVHPVEVICKRMEISSG